MKQISYSARIRHQKGSKSKNWFWSHKLLLWPQYCIFWYFDVVLLISLSTVFDESFISATYLFRKVNVGLFKKIILIWFDESSLKLNKNTFYCILKAIFVLKIFLVLSYLFGHIEKINTNIRLISKFMTSQPG